MANDPQKQQDDGADISFADILKEFESTNRPASRETAAPAGMARGRSKRPPSPSHRGTVVGVSSDFVLIDYGSKSEGMIPAADLRDREGQLTVKVGDSFDVAIVSFDNEGMATLSRVTGPRPRDWDGLTRAF